MSLSEPCHRCTKYYNYTHTIQKLSLLKKKEEFKKVGAMIRAAAPHPSQINWKTRVFQLYERFRLIEEGINLQLSG
jgi:hypothetical protein